MASSYNWPFVAHRRALINAATSVVLVVLVGWLYLHGSGWDLSWIALAGPVLLYHAWIVWRQAQAFRDGDRHAGRALAVLAGLKVGGWGVLAVWGASHRAWGWLVLAVVMAAVKVGELGIYLRALKAGLYYEESGNRTDEGKSREKN